MINMESSCKHRSWSVKRFPEKAIQRRQTANHVRTAKALSVPSALLTKVKQSYKHHGITDYSTHSFAPSVGHVVVGVGSVRLPTHRTETSSLWLQSWPPQVLCGQCAMSVSEPSQDTWSSQTGPVKPVKRSLLTEPSLKPSMEHTTL